MTDRKPDKGRRDDPNSADAANLEDTSADGGLGSPARDTASPRPVGSRRDRYLVAAVGGGLPPGVAPFSTMSPFGALAPFGVDPAFADNLFAQLEADPATTVHRVIQPAAGTDSQQLNALGMAVPAVTFPKVAVVEMEPDRAAMLNAGPSVHVELDLPLQYTAPSPAGGMTFADPGVIPLGDETSVAFVVLGSDGKALEGAEIYLMSEAFPVRGVTGNDGTAVLNTPAGALPGLNGVYVKPRYDYWAVWLGRPQLSTDAPNLVTCPSFTETFPGFPQRQLDSWARRAMRFDALPPIFRGHGVRIGIIDSGVSVEHPDLSGRITAGRDIPGQNDTGWQVDTVGHGSHTAGIIGGTDNGYGIVGVVPEAEIHSCKIFPGGRFSDLIEALDYCMVHNIDVVNLSLGSPQPSPLLARKITQAREAGVACVVAAGNSGGAVCFPASMPTVLAVAAIGKIGEYPPESYHATQVGGAPTPDGYFTASFTCFGPEIDVCAPGVAIVSSVPHTNYAAWDGTSFAAPYVSGLAALLLAHHPEFRDRFAARGSARVDRLFDLIRASCRPLALGDPGRSGAGLPDAVAALGLFPPVPTSPPADPLLAELWTAMARAGLISAAVPTLLPGGIAPGLLAANVASAGVWPTAGAPGWPTVGAPVWPTAGAPGWPTPAGASAWAAPIADPLWASGAAAQQPEWAGAVPAAASFGAGSASMPPRPGATLTPPSSDALDPLRAAMRAAGLMPHDLGSGQPPADLPT
jgi:subtilisin